MSRYHDEHLNQPRQRPAAPLWDAGRGIPRNTYSPLQPGARPAAALFTPASGAPALDRPAVRPTSGPVASGRGNQTGAVAGLVALALVGGLSGWFLGRPGASPPEASPSPAAVVTTPAAASPSETAQAFGAAAKLDATAAGTEVEKAGLRTVGDPVEAWSWTDANGRNLLLTTKQVQAREGGAVRAATLHVYQVSGLGRRPRMLITPLRDPGTSPCDLDFNLDFVPGSIQVTDRDGDGFGEASVGWWSSCRGDPGPVRLKLAVLTRGTYYILRGTGLVASMRVPPGITVPPATFTPNVAGDRWPRGTYDATVALFRHLFR
jgi:hypothetical protein